MKPLLEAKLGNGLNFAESDFVNVFKVAGTPSRQRGIQT